MWNIGSSENFLVNAHKTRTERKLWIPYQFTYYLPMPVYIKFFPSASKMIESRTNKLPFWWSQFKSKFQNWKGLPNRKNIYANIKKVLDTLKIRTAYTVQKSENYWARNIMNSVEEKNSPEKHLYSSKSQF